MSVDLLNAAKRLDGLLELWKFKGDASNNGLQFEGSRRELKKIAYGVDASAKLFELAAEAGADLVFVHHGISWGSSLKRINGVNAGRVALLAKSGLSLYAAHLPLDAHPSFGHNALLARKLGLKGLRPFAEYSGSSIGFSGELAKPMSCEEIALSLDKSLASSGPWRLFGDKRGEVSRIGAVSGGGCWPELMDEMTANGVECLVTGEVEHEAFNAIREAKVGVVAMGHYRSETPGVLAVMEEVERSLGIPGVFIDLPTGL